MKITLYQRKYFDLKEIHLKYKDLSKIIQQRSHSIEHLSRKKHSH